MNYNLKHIMLIVGIGFSLILFNELILQDVDAITRLEIKDIEKQIRDLDTKIAQTDIDISEKNIQINNQNLLLENKKNELRDTRAKTNESWDSILAVDVIEKELQDIQTIISDSRKELSNLLTIKSDHIKLQKELKQLLITSNHQLTNESKFDYSHLAKMISIEISTKCKTMILNNYTSDCPDYLALRSLDSSIQSVSGYFAKKDGFYYRLPPTMIESWRYYDTDPTPRIFVNAPNGQLDKTKQIIIESNFDTYMLAGDMVQNQEYELVDVTINGTVFKKAVNVTVKNKTQDFGLILYHDRYVDAKCSKAIINAKLWKSLLPDTIDYMRNGCDENHTSFVTKEIIPANFTPQDISTSQKYKDEQRLKYIKEFCIYKYQSCKE